MIFLYEPKLLEESQRCDALIQQDYIHSCGVLFASNTLDDQHLQLQIKFRLAYGAPLILWQPWFPDYPRELL